MKAKHILGTVTIVAIIGGTIYAIKKSKDAKKAEGEEITLAEAKAIVAEKEFNKSYPTYFEDEALIEYAKADVEATRQVVARLYEDQEFNTDDEEDEEEPITIEQEPEEDDVEELDDTEEGDELRYEPSSKEARTQFIKMELADWAPLEDAHQTLTNLFNFPFKPQNDGDHDLYTKIIDYRVRFFTFGSRWAKEVTIADVILYFARKAEFDVGESVRYWTEYFLEFNELDFTQPSYLIDDILNMLNSHTYFNEERTTFGLFGLSRKAMDNAISIANRNIDRSVTYEIEFEEFLKSCI